jgi:hypothetical protein
MRRKIMDRIIKAALDSDIYLTIQGIPLRVSGGWLSIDGGDGDDIALREIPELQALEDTREKVEFSITDADIADAKYQLSLG